ncbi:sensor domain-containing diguanylate cyclase [Methylobacterium sp. J-059]|uniref:sensor domain-containing diguanylate cyclase n=1 Tax=Methylobacterium sp. J-059 TaxID=2836643 RepID=UPI001FBBA2A3|nr:sensor domain-containing diguanylate cyclase [Methylobacterium sp. J-059]MCJ2041354.1 sensor domain-containing diguanylate cyclase [Methylobacterium sp. J-059]
MTIRSPFALFGRWTHSARSLTAFNLACVAGLCSVSAVMLWDMREDATRRTEITSRSLLQVLERDIARNIELYGLSLQAVVDGMKRPDVAQASPELRHMILFDRSATGLGFGFIMVMNATGDLVSSSQSITPRALNRADGEYFQYFIAHSDDGLHISPPAISRLTGQWVVMLSRRLSNPDGSFAGVVAGAIHLDYFRGLFAAAGVARIGTVTLYGPGGSILMREPFEQQLLGKSVAQQPSYQRILAHQDGSFVGPAMFGEGERRFVFTHVRDQPLQLSTAIPLADIYTDWWQKALILGGTVLALCGATIGLTWLFCCELNRRRAAEMATSALNVELEQLATTDGLTGLPNRRRFDEVLAQEWSRAVRTSQPLSLILLDADSFKGFNDRYGHQKGDEALELIARSMEAVISRSDDTGYRIGGEEFAVILPDTGEEGAKIVASRIQETVAGWKLPHASSKHEVLTVSCGVAQIPEGIAIEPAVLFCTADAALYEAKRLGRNCVRVSGSVGSDLRLVVGG